MYKKFYSGEEKMKKKKVIKFLSVLLSTAMVVTSVPVYASTENFTENASEQADTEQINDEQDAGKMLDSDNAFENQDDLETEGDLNENPTENSGESVADTEIEEKADLYEEVEEEQTIVQSSDSDFTITDNVLTAYSGTAAEIVIPEGVTKIASSVFSGKKEITSVALPSSLTTIGDNAFSYCSNLTKIELPESLKTIGNQAFQSTGIKELKIPKNVETLGIGAFQDCAKLGKVEVEGTKDIDCVNYPFYGCNQIKEIIFPEGMTKIPEGIFKMATLAEGVQVTIPMTVTEIGGQAFIYCSNLTEVDLPEGLKTIGSSAFQSTGIKELKIPKTVETLGIGAFQDCVALGRVEVEGTKDIDCVNYPFRGCNQIKEIIFPEGMTKIPEGIFKMATLAEGVQVTIPMTVTEIGGQAFIYCSNLTEVDLPEGLKTIGSSAFQSTGIKELKIPKTVETLGIGAFQDCVALGRVEVEGTKDIDCVNYPFRGCNQIKEIIFPEGMTKIPEGIFKIATLAEGVQVTIPTTVTEIGDNAFGYCSNLTEINLPEGLKTIGNHVFESTGIAELTVPGNVTMIGDYAFNNVKLSRIVIPASVKEIGTSAITNNEDLKVVVVQGSYAEKWATANGFNVLVRYGITYQLNGGQIENANPTVYETGDSITFNEPVRTGYTFDGWYTDSKCTKPFEYQAGITKGNLTLYAKWQVITYTIAYDVDGGNLTKSNPTSYDVTKTITLNAPAKEGYTFQGWQVNGDDTQIIKNIAKGTTENLSLKAIWKENKYTVRFNANAKDAKGIMEDETVNYTDTHMIGEEGYTRSGYDFIGWNTMANGKGKWYQEGDTVQSLSAADNAIVNLYAQWQIKPYEITYELNGGTNNAKNPITYDGSRDITLQKPTKQGYTFGGWYWTNDFSGTKVTKIAKTTADDITLYARWTENSYSITYNANGGKRVDGQKGTTERVTGIGYESAVEMPNETLFERAGYTFDGWNTTAKGTGTAYEPGEQDASRLSDKNNANVTLYAQWKLNTYAIRYELDGGENNAKNVSSYNVTKDAALKNPTKTGYTFGGWYTEADNMTKATKVTKIAKNACTDVTVYAQWIENSYSVKFDKNGGMVEGIPAKAETYNYSEEIQLSEIRGENAEEPTRTGYTFEGWNTRKDGSGTHYDKDAAVSGLTDKNKATVTLYAEWKAIPYSITYQAVLVDAEGFPEMKAESELEDYTNPNPETYDIRADVSLKNPVMKGYTFAGWYGSEKDTSVKNAKKVTKISKNGTEPVQLYAKFTENRYKVKYNANGVKAAVPKEETLAYTEETTLPAFEAARNGYTFSGWNTNQKGTGTHYEAGEAVKGIADKNNASVTLYAEWTPVRHTVQYENMNGAANAEANRDHYDITADLALKNPTRTGYTFAGWYEVTADNLKPAEGAKKITKISKTRTDDVILYADWTENTYNIRYNANGGTGKMADTKNVSYTENMELTENAFMRKGYTFSGWNTVAKGTGDAYGDKESVKGLLETDKKTIVLYAQWSADDNQIQYIGVEGADNSMNPDTYTVAESVKLKAPEKAGHTFGGWYKDENCMKKGDSIAKGNAETKTFYAKWIENKYNVRFSLNGGEGTAKSLVKKAYSSSVTLPGNNVTKEGYTFKGWGTSAKGAAVYQAGQKVDMSELYRLTAEKSGTPSDGQYFILYAIWEKTE